MGMGAMGGRCYRELSGGQQQRVLLARALCAAERLLLLDEPVAGLDPGVTQELYDLIGKLNREGVTIVMISHDIAAMRYATHILHIGSQLFFGAVDEYRQSAIGRRFLATEGGEST
jgi:zinc transport system ATP-binding protein